MTTQRMIDAKYEDVEKLIHHTVWRFKKQYKGDQEELLAEARYHYMQAYWQWDPEMGMSFSGWVAQYVWYRLLDTKKRQARIAKMRLSHKEASTLLEEIQASIRFDFNSFLFDLPSKDAQRVAKMAVFPTRAMKRIIGKDGAVKALEHPARIRSTIKRVLENKGWTKSRIDKAFNVVRRNL